MGARGRSCRPDDVHPGVRKRRPPGAPRAFLAYSIEADRWRRLRAPPDLHYELVATGDRLVAYRDGPPISYDARPDRWNRLPPPPLGTRDVDQLVWSGERLVAFGCVETDDVCLARAAVLEPSGWRRLPDATDIDMWPTWEPAGDLVVNPTFGRINDEDPEYLSGGILDLRTGEWSTLPNPPSPRHWVGGAVLTEEVAHYDVDHAWIWAPP